MRIGLFSLYFTIGLTISNLFAAEHFFFEEGKLTPPLIELLKLDNLYEEGDGLNEAVEKTQKKWIGVLQGRGAKERTDMIDPPEWKKIAEPVLLELDRLGVKKGRGPTQKKYDYAFLYGAFLRGMRYRLQEILKAWDEGVRFDELVVLTGERPLRLGPGEPDELLDLKPIKQVVHEADLAELLLQEAELPPSIKVTIISAKKVGGQRPSTGDTIREWLKTKPKSGSIFAPSHPLLFIYQDLVAKNILPSDFYIETTGEEYHPQGENFVSLIFDTIAKSLFEIKIKYSNPITTNSYDN